VDGLVSREEIMSFLEPLLFDDEIVDPWMIGYENFEKEKPPLKFSGK